LSYQEITGIYTHKRIKGKNKRPLPPFKKPRLIEKCPIGVYPSARTERTTEKITFGYFFVYYIEAI
jgi:hypothetical protein